MYRAMIEIGGDRKMAVDVDVDTEDEVREEIELEFGGPWRRMFGKDGVRIMRIDKVTPETRGEAYRL